MKAWNIFAVYVYLLSLFVLFSIDPAAGVIGWILLVFAHVDGQRKFTAELREVLKTHADTDGKPGGVP